jgi:hypothetical protein
MLSRIRRAGLVIPTAGVLLLATALSGQAQASTVKGSPQPEAKTFTIGASDSAGSVAVESNGDLVVTYDLSNGKVRVCVMKRGGHSCTYTSNLSPLSDDDLFGVPQVFALPRNHVVVLQGACCDSNGNGDVLYTSTNGGKTFGAPARVGSLGVSTAELVGNTIVFTSGDNLDGSQVESIPVTASGPPSTIATPTSKTAYDVAVGQYKGGVIDASDYLGSDYTTYVEYAASGSNFDSSSSYRHVATFPHEEVLAMSGNALLTLKTTGKYPFELRFFNGSSFGAAHAVPGFKGDEGNWWTIDKDPSGVTHIFDESSAFSPSYELEEISTKTGAHWTSRRKLGNATDSTKFAAGLDSTGSGLVMGNGDSKAFGYPILATQSVSFSLSHSSISKGHSVTAKGKGRAAAKGRTITLERLEAGLWHTVAHTKESHSGAFHFTIKGKSAGSFTYRAVASDHAGYVEYGYSSARTLHVS